MNASNSPYIPRWLDDAGLATSRFRVLCHLYRRRNKYDQLCNPSISSIAETCRIKPKTVAACLNNLEAAGLLTRQRTRSSNHYTLTNPAHIKLDTPKGVVSPLPQIVPQTTHQIVPQTVHEIGSKGHYKGTPPKVILLKEEMMSFPASLDNPDFKAAWQDWITYRQESRLRTWIPRTVKAQLEILAAMGSASAIMAIRASIAGGWQGIYAPRPGNGQQTAQRKAWFR
jgi:hypothetical protein